MARGPGRPRKEVIEEIRNRTAAPISFTDRASQRQAEAIEAFNSQAGEIDPDAEAAMMAEKLWKPGMAQLQPQNQEKPALPLPAPKSLRPERDEIPTPKESPLISFTQKAYNAFVDQGIDHQRAATLTLAYAVIELGAVIQGLKK